MRVLAAVLAIGAIGGAADAQRLELVGRVVATPMPVEHHGMFQLGDERYISVSMTIDEGRDVRLDAVDVATAQLVPVRIARRDLAKRVGASPDLLELVALDDAAAGVHAVERATTTGDHRHWYLEVDRATGAIARASELGTFAATSDVYFLGTDLAHRSAWFYEERYDAVRDPARSYNRPRGPKQIIVSRFDLAKRAVDVAATLALPARAMKSGYEDRVFAYHARDFSRLAFVEYDEDAFRTKPPASVYFVDLLRGTSFAVPAFDTTYGVAFAPDGRYAYLASHQLGTIARVDLAAKKIDKQIRGPTLVQRLVVSPNGDHLFVIGLGQKYTVYALPDLSRRIDVEHSPDVVQAAKQMSSHGQPSLDGRYFVMADALGDPHKLVVLRVSE